MISYQRINELIEGVEEVCRENLQMKRAIEMVLLFHSGEPWTPANQKRWEIVVGDEEATSKVLCDFLRSLQTSG